MKNLKTEKKIYTVSEITRDIHIILKDSFSGIWIEGEISDYRGPQSSGHMYFKIRDQKSILPCAMFKRANTKLKFKLENGMKLICFGSIGVYEPRGYYQLIIEEVEPKGIGALQLQFEQLKEKLRKEGLFDPSHKVSIPYLPTRIGVVTSPTGAAIHDILNVSRRRFSNVEIIINPVRVQGESAKEEIANAINEFNRLKNVDVLIVGRGGGSLEDLWAFNEEIVARAIYNSNIPVISAVGHEIDFTIADFVADKRVPTPSAAAELVIPEKEKLTEKINISLARLKNVLIRKLDLLEEKLTSLRKSYVLKQPLNLVLQYEQGIDDLTKSLGLHIDHILKMRKENFNLLIHKLEALSPLAILGRGYSITTKLPENSILKDAKILKKDDMVKTRLGKGTFTSKIEKIDGGGQNGGNKV